MDIDEQQAGALKMSHKCHTLTFSFLVLSFIFFSLIYVSTIDRAKVSSYTRLYVCGSVHLLCPFCIAVAILDPSFLFPCVSVKMVLLVCLLTTLGGRPNYLA